MHLPSNYPPVIVSFDEINKNALVTLESVKGDLLDYDLQRKDERKSKRNEPAEKNESAFCLHSTTQKSDFKPSGKLKEKPEFKTAKSFCDYCHCESHKEYHCFKKKNNHRKKGDSKFSNEANVASG